MADIKQIQVGNTKYNISGAAIVLEDNNTTVNGTWLAKTNQINSLEDGQIFLYKLITTPGSTTTSLNITGSAGTALGAKTVYRYGTTKLAGLTETYSVGECILLTYNSTNDCFKVINDYDANSTNFVRYDTNTQGLNATQKSNARTNIGAGTSNFSGSYNDLTDKPIIDNNNQTVKGNGTAFGANAAVNIVAGSNVTVTPDTTNNKITISSTDNDTKNTAGTTNKTATKMYLAAATSQGANPQTYSNINCYIGTDNCLYSGGNKVLTSNAVSSVNSKTGAVVLTDNDISTNSGTFINLHNVAERVNDLSSDFVYAGYQYNAKYAIKPVYSNGSGESDALLYTDVDDEVFKFNKLGTGFIYTYTDVDDNRRFDYVPFTGSGLFYRGSTGRDFKLLSTSDLRTKINGNSGTQIETSAGTPELTLSANTTYKLDAGGDYFIFKTPADTNTNYYSKPNYTSSNGIKIATGYSGSTASTTYDLYAPKATTSQAGVLKIGTTASDACAGNDSRLSDSRTPTSHTHGNITNTGTITSTAVTTATGVLVYDSNNKIQRATAAQTRTIIGAGTSNLTIGTTSTTAAAGNHTHNQYAEVVSFSGGDLILKINN